MQHFTHTKLLPSLLACMLFFSAMPIQASENRYTAMTATEVKGRLAVIADKSAVNDDVRRKMDALWQPQSQIPVPPRDVMDRALQSFALFDPALERFSSAVRTLSLDPIPDLVKLAARPGQDPFVITNLRAALGNALAEARCYDEALEQLRAVDLEQAIDPATVLFFRAVAAQEILELPLAIESVETLLTRTDNVPQRYLSVAELMQVELAGLQSQSLGEVARLMHDSERRLDLGRAGERVQGVQDRIIANLDELIKKLESQQGGGGGGGAGAGNSNQSSSGADDSRVKGATAPGESDDKTFSKQGRWGDLPEKEQAQAKNLINREFPSHYRQAVEMYFKKLANRPAPTPSEP